MPTSSVAALNVYPVKSCSGIGQEEVSVAPRGLVASTASGNIGDREWMIVDRDGTFVTQREYPRLASIGTALESGALVLRTHNGAAPKNRIMHVASFRRDIEVAADSNIAKNLLCIDDATPKLSKPSQLVLERE